MVHFEIARIRLPKGSKELVFVSDIVASLQLVTSLPRFHILWEPIPKLNYSQKKEGNLINLPNYQIEIERYAYLLQGLYDTSATARFSAAKCFLFQIFFPSTFSWSLTKFYVKGGMRTCVMSLGGQCWAFWCILVLDSSTSQNPMFIYWFLAGFMLQWFIYVYMTQLSTYVNVWSQWSGSRWNPSSVEVSHRIQPQNIKGPLDIKAFLLQGF